MNGFKFNNIHSSTYGIILESYTIGTPEKKKVEIEVPYRHGTLDFSTFFNGENTFSNRDLEVKFHVVSKTVPELKVIYNRITEWLIDTPGKQELIFDNTRGYYFLAEVVNSIDYEEFYTAGTFTVQFKAEPFRKSIDYQGHLITWDNFNFLEDVLNTAQYNNTGTKEYTLYHSGRKTNPTIKVTSGSVKVKSGNYTTPTLQTGEHIDYNFYINRGKNIITVTGTGKLELLYKKEAF